MWNIFYSCRIIPFIYIVIAIYIMYIIVFFILMKKISSI
jgi:hypothetical protein